MPQTHEFQISTREIVGWCSLGIRAYTEDDDDPVEVGSPSDCERRALSRSLGAIWPVLPESAREMLTASLSEFCEPEGMETFRTAIKDLQRRAQIESEIAAIPDSPDEYFNLEEGGP